MDTPEPSTPVPDDPATAPEPTAHRRTGSGRRPRQPDRSTRRASPTPPPSPSAPSPGTGSAATASSRSAPPPDPRRAVPAGPPGDPSPPPTAWPGDPSPSPRHRRLPARHPRLFARRGVAVVVSAARRYRRRLRHLAAGRRRPRAPSATAAPRTGVGHQCHQPLRLAAPGLEARRGRVVGVGALGQRSAIAAEVDPGLVDINVTLSYQDESAAGTGQVLTSSGLVLTNNHVIDEATSISAVDIGNGKTYTASVVGYDRTGDLAVIQLHGASGLSTVTIGDSSKVAVGESVVAIGNAGGVGAPRAWPPAP